MRKNCRLPKIILYQTLFRSLEPLLSGNEYFNRDDENTRMLENILISVISLVVVLVIILFYITFKTRSTQNRFKLLDNSGNFQSESIISVLGWSKLSRSVPSIRILRVFHCRQHFLLPERVPGRHHPPPRLSPRLPAALR